MTRSDDLGPAVEHGECWAERSAQLHRHHDPTLIDVEFEQIRVRGTVRTATPRPGPCSGE